MTRRFLLVAALLTALLGMLPASAAFAAGPEAVGWWQRTSAGGLTTPAPPDVPDGGMLVEGIESSEGSPSTPPPPGSPPGGEEGSNETGYRAIGALRFSIPPGGIPTALTLTVAGEPSPGARILACAATGPFEAAHGGPWSEKPTYDCSSSATAEVGDDGTLAFSNVDNLIRGDALSIVLLPAGAVRVAIEPPGDDSLAVTESGGGFSGPSTGSGDTGFSSPPPPPPATSSPPAGSTGSSGGSGGAYSAPAFDPPTVGDLATGGDDLAQAPPPDDPPPIQSAAPASSQASEFPTGPAVGTLAVVVIAALLLWKIPPRYPVVVRSSATGRTGTPS